MTFSLIDPQVVPEYFIFGFSHILPHGLDHVLFILGLFFLSRNFSMLLFQMTLFTMAHSLTLGLALFGFVSVPTVVVEVAIALSISFIAIENLLMKDQPGVWRPWVVFLFGLIHGLGFAHTFPGKEVPQENFLTALFSFNIGIEIGQLIVVGLATVLTFVAWRRDWYASLVTRPACILIAACGLWMAVVRVS